MNEAKPHVAGCRNCHCLPCTRKRKAYRFEHDHGIRRMTLAGPAREHLALLRANGVGRRTISQALGLAEPTLMRISSGDTKMVHKNTERRILAFGVEDASTVPNARAVDATATRLRYQALIALGYTQEFVAKSTGRAHVGIDIGQRVSRRRALAILELCLRIGDTPGPSVKAAVQARNKGWRRPVDYDEDLFYSPAWDGTEPEATVAVTSKEQYLREYDFLHRQTNSSVEEIADRLGITRGYLVLLLSRRERGLIPFEEEPELGLAG
jgi:hypothetical protein